MLFWGVIDSFDIFFNVFCSVFINYCIVCCIVDYIVKKVGDCFKFLYDENLVEYFKCWEDIGIFVKFGFLWEDKFK